MALVLNPFLSINMYIYMVTAINNLHKYLENFDEFVLHLTVGHEHCIYMYCILIFVWSSNSELFNNLNF
jgi:hypothetical protein